MKKTIAIAFLPYSREISEKAITKLSPLLFILYLWLAFNPANQVYAQNNPPSIDSLELCTAPMTPLTICISVTDPEGDDFAIVDGYTTFNCSIHFLNDTCVRYTPLPGFLGTDTIYLESCDDQTPSACSESVIYVHVGCLAPIAHDDNIVVSSNAIIINGSFINTTGGYSGVMFDAAANDDAICNNTLNIPYVLIPPTHGSATVLNSTQINYIPNNGFYGVDTLTYVSCNNCPLCDTARVTYNILPPNANCNTDIYICTTPYASIDLCPDFCNTAINSAEISATAQHGTVDALLNGCFLYVPDAGYEGNDEIVFTACNTLGICEESTTHITIAENCGSHPPTATPDFASTLPNTDVLIYILDNDFDLDGQTISLSTIGDAQHGEVTYNAIAQTVLYQPANGFEGIDTITYVICDETGLCSEAIITINVIQPCGSSYEYCTQPFTPVTICVDFCNLQGHEGVHITDASTTFNCSIHLLSDTCLRYMPLPAFLGTDQITIVGCDANNICDTIQAVVHVGCIAPQADNDVAQVLNTLTTEVDVLANDIEVCGNPLSSAIITAPAHGTATANPNGTISYTPNSGYTGLDTLTYQACTNCQNLCDQAILVLQVNDGNISLNAVNDTIGTPLNSSISIAVLLNDDITQTGVALTITQPPTNGTASVITQTGVIHYIPENGFQGIDTLTYQICDANMPNVCDIATVIIVVGNVNLPPIAVNDTAYTMQNNAVTILLLLNDSDLNHTNNQLSVTIIEQPQNGSVTVANGQAIYIPNHNYVGSDTFTYSLCDPSGDCDLATVWISITPPPTANPDIAYTAQPQPITINVLQNDIGTSLVITTFSQPIFGSVVLNIDGTFTYTPINGYEGTDYFTYQICDNYNYCDETAVSITVVSMQNPNLPPIAGNDAITTMQNTGLFIPILDNDHDPEQQPLLIVNSSQPTNGIALVTPEGMSYLPNNGFSGIDSLFYLVCDIGGLCDTAWVFINVGGTTATNHAPTAAPEEAITTPGQPITIPVLNNDTDPDADDLLEVVYTTTPANGTASITPNGQTIVYTPNENYIGIDYLIYIVCDNGVPQLCDSTYVTINILTDGGADIFEQTPEDTDIVLCITDYLTPSVAIDTIVFYTNPQNGSPYYGGNDACIIYSPDLDYTGADSFNIGVCNAQGICDTISILLEVLPEPDAPVAINDTASTQQNTPVDIAVLTNDNNPDNTPIFVSGITPPQHGTVVLIDNQIRYIPNADFIGTDQFSYTITNDAGQTSTAIVVITVLEAELHLVAVDDTKETTLNTTTLIDVATNDTIPANPIPIFSIISQPENGQVSNQQSVFSYIPQTGFTGTDSFQYSVCIGAICDTATVTIHITADEACLIKVANAFSPNGDDINDTFEIDGLDCYENTNISIFNRWGNLIYQAPQYNHDSAWDGTWGNAGQPVPDGTYFYTLKLTQGDKTEQKSGFIEVFR